MPTPDQKPNIANISFRRSIDLYIDGKATSGMIVNFKGEPKAIAAVKDAAQNVTGVAVSSVSKDGHQLVLNIKEVEEAPPLNEMLPVDIKKQPSKFSAAENTIAFIRGLDMVEFAQPTVLINQDARAAAMPQATASWNIG